MAGSVSAEAAACPCTRCGGSGQEPAAAVLLRLTLPIQLESEANLTTASRGGRMARAARTKRQRGLTKLLLTNTGLDPSTWAGPLTVTLTRIAPRQLDSDNATISAKHVRDQAAEWLGVNDRDPRVTWVVAQRYGGPMRYDVELEIRRGT